MRFNPFEPQRIVQPGMFVGRLDELNKIKHALWSTQFGSPVHFVIHGERGIGKSSLLLYTDWIASGQLPVERDEKPLNFITITLDIRNQTTYEGLIRQISHKLYVELNSRRKVVKVIGEIWGFIERLEVCGVKLNKKEVLELDGVALLDDLVAVLSRLFSRKESIEGILLLIDEADKAVADVDLGSLMKALSEQLDKEGVNRLCIGLSGLSPLLEKLKASHPSSPRLFTYLELMPLTEAECRKVVQKGLNLSSARNNSETTIESGALEQLYRFSEGYPHLLQQFAYCAFEVDKDWSISKEDVIQGAVCENGAFKQLGQRYFEGQFFSELNSEEYRTVLRAMSGANDKEWMSRREIMEAAKTSSGTLNNALRKLKDKGIIVVNPQKNGEYRIPSGAFRVWISLFSHAGINSLD